MVIGGVHIVSLHRVDIVLLRIPAVESTNNSRLQCVLIAMVIPTWYCSQLLVGHFN